MSVTFHVGVALLVITKPQCHPFSGLQGGWSIQKVIQKLVVDLIERHPDGKLHPLHQIISSTVWEAVGLQANTVSIWRRGGAPFLHGYVLFCYWSTVTSENTTLMLPSSPSSWVAMLLMEDSPPIPLSQMVVVLPRRELRLSSCDKQKGCIFSVPEANHGCIWQQQVLKPNQEVAFFI